jgi:hypothetical protein
LSAGSGARTVLVLRFGTRPEVGALAAFDTVDVSGAEDIDTAAASADRLVVLGSDADLASVLTRLMRTERLGVELAHARGWRGTRRAVTAPARRVPLIRDDAGQAVVGAAEWRGGPDTATLTGEGIVDDALLFSGDVAGVRIEPTDQMPGLRAAVLSARGRPGRWLTGRAAQLGTVGAVVVRDGVPGQRAVKRSTFYRHTEGWLRVG